MKRQSNSNRYSNITTSNGNNHWAIKENIQHIISPIATETHRQLSKAINLCQKNKNNNQKPDPDGSRTFSFLILFIITIVSDCPVISQHLPQLLTRFRQKLRNRQQKVSSTSNTNKPSQKLINIDQKKINFQLN